MKPVLSSACAFASAGRATSPAHASERGRLTVWPRAVPRMPLAFGLALALSLAGCGGDGAPAAASAAASGGVAAPAAAASAATRPALSVSTTRLQAADWPRIVPANGSIAAWQEAVIGSESAGLRLVDVRVNVGDVVRRGQVLAELQRDTVQADLSATRANLAEAQANQAEARANADRARQLQPSGVMSAQQIQQYLTAEQAAKARTDALRSQLAVQELRLQQTRVLAPDDGVISARTATVGAVVQPGTELFRLIRQNRLEWRAEVPQTELPRVRPGQPAVLTLAGGGAVQGRVRMLAPTVDANTRNGLVYVDLPSSGPARAGMFATGHFDVGRAAAQTLPQSAVLLRDGFSYVFVVGAQSRVAQQKVVVGRRQGERVEIVEGLGPDAAVVAAGAGFLSDGDTVLVVPPAPAATAAASSSAPR